MIIVVWDQECKLPWSPEPGDQEVTPRWQLEKLRHQTHLKGLFQEILVL